MREILFRGKRTDKWGRGEWAEGYLDVFEGTPFILFNYDDPYTYHRVEVDPTTVGQYTGMKDKTGKRIFEGDFARLDEEVKRMFNIEDGAVRYGWGGFYVKDIDTLNSLHAIADMDMVLRGEVVGNIHDSPELLEVAK